mmetsp:Transcript_19319/g.74077  ORF Transcript_19319/g.74077 Transcript_19319/m.74077 type:complete len:360 (-) Transcript_19319:2882-3961(-)
MWEHSCLLARRPQHVTQTREQHLGLHRLRDHRRRARLEERTAALARGVARHRDRPHLVQRRHHAHRAHRRRLRPQRPDRSERAHAAQARHRPVHHQQPRQAARRRARRAAVLPVRGTAGALGQQRPHAVHGVLAVGEGLHAQPLAPQQRRQQRARGEVVVAHPRHAAQRQPTTPRRARARGGAAPGARRGRRPCAERTLLPTRFPLRPRSRPGRADGRSARRRLAALPLRARATPLRRALTRRRALLPRRAGRAVAVAGAPLPARHAPAAGPAALHREALLPHGPRAPRAHDHRRATRAGALSDCARARALAIALAGSRAAAAQATKRRVVDARHGQGLQVRPGPPRCDCGRRVGSHRG